MDYQAILFDFDYTLGDATEAICEGFWYGFARMGCPAPDREQVRSTVGYILEDGFTLLTGDADPDRRREFCRLFREKVRDNQAEKTVIFPGAKELLRTCRERGIKLGVVSSKRSDTLRRTLEYHGLMELLDYVVGGELVSRPKPDPEGLNAGIEALGAERARVLYCGDTTIDAGTAQGAGVDFSAVLGGTTPASAFRDFPHVHIAPDLIELREWLGV